MPVSTYRWEDIRESHLTDDQRKRMSTPVIPGAHCDHAWAGGKKAQRCANCGATCIRDDRGVIVDYDRVPGQYVEGISTGKSN